MATHFLIVLSAKVLLGHCETHVNVVFSAKYPGGQVVTHKWLIWSAKAVKSVGHPVVQVLVIFYPNNPTGHTKTH